MFIQRILAICPPTCQSRTGDDESRGKLDLEVTFRDSRVSYKFEKDSMTPISG